MARLVKGLVPQGNLKHSRVDLLIGEPRSVRARGGWPRALELAKQKGEKPWAPNPI